MTLWQTIRARAEDEILLDSIKLATHLSNNNLLKLLSLFERIDKNQEHAQSIRRVKQLFAQGHPSVALVRRLFTQVHPRCLEKLVRDMLLKTILRGSPAFDAFVEEEGFHPPYVILISPTMRCNLRCKGCYAGTYSRRDDLEREVIERVIEEAAGMGVYFITLLGGEPFIRPDLLDICRRHPGSYFQVFTNGTLITPRLAAEMAQAGNVAVIFSIEGFAETTDARRGRGTFASVMKAMGCLRAEGVPFGFSTVVTRHNIEEATSDALLDLLIDKGALIGWYFLYMPVGRHPALDLMPTPAQRLALKERISRIRDTKSIFVVDFWNDAPYVGGCLAAGHEYLHINSRGDVEPCIFMHLAADNIKEKNLREALKSPFFRAIRRRQPYGENLLTPCTIIDHPEVLREVVEETGPYPTCPGAKSLLDDPDLAAGLKKYARETRAIFDKVWAEEDKTDFKLEGRGQGRTSAHPEEKNPPPARVHRDAA